MSGAIEANSGLFAERYADVQSVQAYPLPVRGHIPWQRTEIGFTSELHLPQCHAQSILVPSLTLLDNHDYRFRFTLVDDSGNCWVLHAVPDWPDLASANNDEATVTTHVDCFHIHRTIDKPRLRVEIQTRAAGLARYLMCCSARPITLEQCSSPTHSACTDTPPAQSQMLAPSKIAQGICSPTSVYMVLRHHHKTVDWLPFVEQCYAPQAKLFGSWPLSLHRASQLGCLGAVEVFDGWPHVLASLERGLPVIASIRYGANELSGAPLKKTGGHLVVVYGADSREVLVLDPAAPDNDSVARRYATVQFTNAWFRNRGAAYILLP